jgi:RNA polymerase sigma factor (sigma-70 family)
MTEFMSDEDLMLQVREGNSEPLGVLFDRYQMPLLNFYSKLTGNRVVSEDLVQEVFFRILKYRHTYRPSKAFRPWIYEIARNARAQQFKKHQAEGSVDPEAIDSLESSSSSVYPAQQNQEIALLHRALMQLPESKREVLVLSRFQELKYEEVAQLLGCQVGAVKVKVHRALQDLREIYHQLERGQSGADFKARPQPEES